MHRQFLVTLLAATLSGQIHASDKDFKMAFGACNRQYLEQPMWSNISSLKPDVFVWAGDIVYGSSDPSKLEDLYKIQNSLPKYKKFKSQTKVLGTWDDHDYGVNNGGKSFGFKQKSQQYFLDFFGVAKNDPRRLRKGVYHSELLTGGRVRVILLDGRYHKDDKYGAKEPDFLGAEQWAWLEKTLATSKARINVIVSGVQVIAEDHRFEKWANFPKRRKQLFDLVAKTKAKGVIFVSGDRHIAEISEIKKYPGIAYPLVDITSSGLTHSSDHFKGEPNRHRLLTTGVPPYSGRKNFGTMTFKFEKKRTKVLFEVRNVSNKVVLKTERVYPL